MVSNDITKGCSRYHRYGMSVEVVDQLSFGDEDCVEQFLYLGVPCLGLLQHFTDEIHWPLELEHVALSFSLDHQRGAKYLDGGRDVEKENFAWLRSH